MERRLAMRKMLALQVYAYFCQHYVRPIQLAHNDVAFVFGRADVTLADTAAWLYFNGRVHNVLITGGRGKDSGPLAELSISEAGFLAAYMAVKHHIPLSDMVIEEGARNGGENARLGLAKILERKLPLGGVTLVGHATNLFRLSRTFKREAQKLGLAPRVSLVAPPYNLSPEDETLQLLELMKIVEGADKDWMVLPPDMPLGLVYQVREFLAEEPGDRSVS